MERWKVTVGHTLWVETQIEVDANNRADALKIAKASAVDLTPKLSIGIGDGWIVKANDTYTDASKVKHLGKVVDSLERGEDEEKKEDIQKKYETIIL